MAFQKVLAINPLGNTIVTDTSAGATGQTVVSSAVRIYAVYANNTTGAKAYVKLYNNATPTIGTNNPDIVLMFPASTARQYSFPEGIPLATALTYACVTTGGTTGTSGCNIPITIVLEV